MYGCMEDENSQEANPEITFVQKWFNLIDYCARRAHELYLTFDDSQNNHNNNNKFNNNKNINYIKNHDNH
jgi:hypothetical protein